MSDRWWLTREMNDTGGMIWVCHKCSNTGLIPFIDMSPTNAGRNPQECAASCDCERQRSLTFKNREGKTLFVGASYNDIFRGGFQFFYTRDIMHGFGPKVSYHEVFAVYAKDFWKRYRKDKIAKLASGYDLLQLWLKGRITDLPNKKMLERVGQA